MNLTQLYLIDYSFRMTPVLKQTTHTMEEPIVEIQNGPIRGVIKKTVEGREYCAFLGIPYAKPPIGNLRFKVR